MEGIKMFDQQKYVNEYIKDNYKTIKLRIRKENNLILKKLKKVTNVNQYIIDLIKKDIDDNRSYNYIDGEIIIDFDLSNTMKDLVEKAEEADFLEDYGLYMNLADAIDSQAKKETNNHVITETEWKQLVRRYSI